MKELEIGIDAKKHNNEQGLVELKAQYDGLVQEADDDYKKDLFDQGPVRETLNNQMARLIRSHRKK